MTTNLQVTVLGPNGRRTNVKINFNTSILQIIEESCTKQKLDSQLYDIKHLRRVLDHSSTVRYSNVPNNALLELIESQTPRRETLITVNLATDTGQRLVADFASTSSLWDILLYHVNSDQLAIPSLDSGLEPVIIYTLRRITGEQLKTTTLKALGLISGNCMLRYNIQKFSPNGPVQANVSSSLLHTKISNVEASFNSSDESGKTANFKSTETEKCTEADNMEKGNEQWLKLHTSKGIEKTKCTSSIVELAPIPQLLETDDEQPVSCDPNVASDNQQQSSNQEGICLDEQMDTDILTNENMPRSDEVTPVSHETEHHSVIKLGSRDAILFNFDDAPPTMMSEESDSFYELSSNEVKKLYQEQVNLVKELEESPLMTRELREFERDKQLLNAMNRHPVTQLRICFPDRHVIQANFKPRNNISEVMDFIRPFLVKPDMQFYLYSVFPKQILLPEVSLVEANCIPKARLYFGSEEKYSAFLSVETLEKKSSFEGATKQIVKARNSVSDSEDGFRLSAGPCSTSLKTQLTDYSSEPKRSLSADKKPKWFKLGR